MKWIALLRYGSDNRPFSACRGCDLQSVADLPESAKILYRIKAQLTARMRAILFRRREWVVGLYTTQPFDEHAYHTLREATLNLMNLPLTSAECFALTHWFNHLEAGVHATAGHRIWNGYAGRIAQLLDSTCFTHPDMLSLPPKRLR